MRLIKGIKNSGDEYGGNSNNFKASPAVGVKPVGYVQLDGSFGGRRVDKVRHGLSIQPKRGISQKTKARGVGADAILGKTEKSMILLRSFIPISFFP